MESNCDYGLRSRVTMGMDTELVLNNVLDQITVFPG
jgi:hypothetical protein